ncbi:divergent polysaccharide deacetylase family protein [Rossellomorea marisflavi]|uniref:divergent polysaccharide deacetylase family protein n=1 Tax=Rossellomorea marisflavi TaxID=189381 RepID=UPI00296E6898|nr:divergent polysaccharide deacetylase family protein [Rossellomorea marisflavi]MDW4528847.1 divergent polysaccharide deacetylase family protein [Rossellomorea marisflavi]
MRILLISLTLSFSLTTTGFARDILPLPAHKKELAIVIDDLGNDMEGTKDILDTEATLTIAVMPFLPSTKKDAERAHAKGHEVILHMPMEPVTGKASWLGPGALTTDLSDEEIRSRVEKAIQDVPHAVGMNHHMGSKVTADERIMRIVLEVCKKHGMFYLDSKTTGKSVIPKLAEELKVPYLENGLFFDDVYTKEHIGQQATKLAAKLEKDDSMVAIGHVGVTGKMIASMLKDFIPVYEKEANIVPLSDLIPEYHLIDESMP